MDAVEVGNKPSVDGSVSEMVLYHTKLALSIVLPSIKLDSLALYHLELALMRPISINISDYARVFEVYNGIVDEESRSGGRVKNIEVVIFDPRAVEIGRGMCMCMKGDGVLGISLFANSYDVSVNPDLSKSDVLCNLILPILIEEDQRVLPCITTVVLAPPSSWVVRVIKLFSELGNVGNGARSGGKGDGGVIRSESDWLLALNVIVQHVPLNSVKDLRDEEEVFNGGVVTKGGGEDLVVKLSVSQDVNCWEEVLRPS